MAYAPHRGTMKRSRWSLQRLKYPLAPAFIETTFLDHIDKPNTTGGLAMLATEDLDFLLGYEFQEDGEYVTIITEDS